MPGFIRPMSDSPHLLAQKNSPLQPPELGAARVGSNGPEHVSCCRPGRTALEFPKGDGHPEVQ